MSEFSHGCPDCGGTGGNHYGDCTYDGVNSSGKAGFGGSPSQKAVFGIFVFIGIFVGVLCPPVGALIVLCGAALTGV